MKFLKDIFTEDDGQSFCIAKAMAAFAFVSFIGYAGYGLFLNKTPDLNNFANGVMQVLIGCGGIIAGKQMTQKENTK